MAIKHLFLDFDETLASSAITWGLDYSIPKLCDKYNLEMDEDRFAKLIIEAIKRTSLGDDMLDVSHWIFEEMNWNPDLQKELLSDVMSNYKATLFDDALPFLEQARSYDTTIHIVSNNPRTHDSIKLLDISDRFDHVFTPAVCSDSVRKPDIRMWHCVQDTIGQHNIDECLMIGDDPWSDAEFASRVGMSCVLVDRKQRFKRFDKVETYQWVRSLLDIQFN